MIQQSFVMKLSYDEAKSKVTKLSPKDNKANFNEKKAT